MSILNYIADKKAKFKNRIEVQRNQNIEAKKIKLRELEEQNKQRNKELKLERDLEKQEKKAKELKKEKFNYTLAGKVVNNIKSKVKESKKANAKNYSGNSGNIFTQSSSYNNPFTKGQLGNNGIFSGSNATKTNRKRS